MRIKSAIISLCTAAIAVAPASVGALGPQSDTTAKNTQVQQKLICRDLETTGTRFKDRVCLTKEEWKESGRSR